MTDFFDKNILALDTATSQLQLALSFGGDRLVKSSEDVERSHGRFLIKKIGELLQSAALKQDQIDALVVCGGPGSFTGLRIGMAAAKGIAVALEIPIASVSLFEIAIAKMGPTTEEYGIVIPLTRDQYFLCPVSDQIFSPDKIIVVSSDELREHSARLLLTSIGFDLKAAEPELTNLAGSGSIAYDASTLLYLGREKLNSGDLSPLESLEPMYLQKSQAELRFDQRQKNR